MTTRQNRYCLSAIALPVLIAGVCFIYSSYRKHERDQATRTITITVSTGTEATQSEIDSKSPLFYYETIFKNDIVEIKFQEDGTLMMQSSEINGTICFIYKKYDDRIASIINSLVVTYFSPTLGNNTFRLSADSQPKRLDISSVVGKTWIKIINVYDGGLSSKNFLPLGNHTINIRITSVDGVVDAKYSYSIMVRQMVGY